MSWFIEGLKRYAQFKGRAHRKEFWMYFLVFIILAVIVAFVEAALELPQDLLTGLFSLALLLPTLGIQVRRLHDVNKSGWWVLINLVPILGFIYLVYLLAQKGDEGDNRFGPVSTTGLS